MNLEHTSVIDLFCGAGGLSHGFKLEGFPITCGIDVDHNCRHAFEENNQAPFIMKDVSKISSNALLSHFRNDSIKILVGCAPCQPFSRYNQKNHSKQWLLVTHFSRLILETQPDIVSMENVPRLKKFHGGKVFNEFVNTLERLGYSVWHKEIFCPDYGIPQSRTRLVLLASKFGSIELDSPSHQKTEYLTVRDAIGSEAFLEAGQVDINDPLHRSINLTNINLARIKASRPGRTWRDWPADLRTKCHRKKTGKGYSSVYGRMEWEKPSPTITTQFYGFGNGRFGHPEQNRGLSLREGAVLQSFPRDYSFFEKEAEINFNKVGRMIGNAVPVRLAQVIAKSIKKHLENKK